MKPNQGMKDGGAVSLVQWATGYMLDDNTIHVWPIAERDHSIDGGVTCWCHPKIELQEKGIIVVHNRRQ
jgi:hypothetical protein